MKLKPDFITHTMNGEQLLISVGSGFSGFARSNASAAMIIDCLKQECTAEDITAALLQKYDVPAETVRADVDRVLEQLRSIGALDESEQL